MLPIPVFKDQAQVGLFVKNGLKADDELSPLEFVIKIIFPIIPIVFCRPTMTKTRFNVPKRRFLIQI
jgi:hypothetical protein